jgi:hypothetical protein
VLLDPPPFFFFVLPAGESVESGEDVESLGLGVPVDGGLVPKQSHVAVGNHSHNFSVYHNPPIAALLTLHAPSKRTTINVELPELFDIVAFLFDKILIYADRSSA